MRTGAARAFTLIELLAALAVVAIVAAVLLTAFSHARENGRRTTCQNNLRQLALAMQQYVGDNDGQFPLNLSVESRGRVNVAVAWQQAISPYFTDAGILHCPDYPADTLDRAGIISHDPLEFVDYDFNSLRLNTFHPPFPTKTVTGVREATLGSPATVWLNEESDWPTIGNKGNPDIYHDCRPVVASCGRTIVGSTRHAGGGNYSFVDGHVQWLSPEAFGETECSNGPLPFPFKD